MIIIKERNNMKIRNLDEGIERRVNPDRELPRRRRSTKREGIIGPALLGGAVAGLAGGLVNNIVDGMDEDCDERETRRTRNRRPVRRGFPVKRVREEESFERTERPNMAKRRPIGKKVR